MFLAASPAKLSVYTEFDFAVNGSAAIVVGVSEIIFEVQEDEVDGGYCASALGVGIHTQADSLEELRANVKEAVDCYFDEGKEAPRLIRLHFVRDEVLAR